MCRADLDFDQCYRATVSRDARFDGWFIVGVRTTGVYCRPSCPSPVCPKPSNVAFFKTAAAAQLAGLRACKRCRPDAIPGSPEWDARSDIVGRATELRLAEVAFAAGFTSVRQFNDTILRVYGTSPSDLRRGRRRGDPGGSGDVKLRFPVRKPYHLENVLRWLADRSVPGIEEHRGGVYRRSLRLPGGLGIMTIAPGDGHVVATFRLETIADLGSAVHRCRRLLDLDADPAAYREVLEADHVLAPLVAANPGLRAPGAVDGAECAMRAVLGPEDSRATAGALARRLVVSYGTPLARPEGSLTHLFPTPEALAEADLAGVGVPPAKAIALRELARLLADGQLVIDAGSDRDECQAAASGALDRTARRRGTRQPRSQLEPVANLCRAPPMDLRPTSLVGCDIRPTTMTPTARGAGRGRTSAWSRQSPAASD